MRNKVGSLAAIGALCVAAAANATVINISATVSGEEQGNGACHLNDQPCNNGALFNPVQVTLAAGTYLVSDAYNLTTGLEPGALYDAWNFEAGNPVAWVWNYTAFYDDGAQGSTINPSNFYNYLLLDVNALPVNRRPTEAQAAAVGDATPVSSFTLDATTTLDFVVNDYYLPDNAGGISLDIESVNPIPEPATWALMLLGLGMVGSAMRATA